jgi:ABC-type Na+ efflux pump permease subunit
MTLRNTLAVLAVLALSSGAAQAASGTLTVYTSTPDKAMNDLIAEFNKAEPDVKVEFFRSGTTEVVNKLQAEFAAGAPQPDVVFIADATVMEQLKADDRLMSYADAPVAGLPDSFYDSDKTYFGTKIIPTGIIYNTNSGKPRPTSWEDLISPNAKDQVIMPSPLYSGDVLIGKYLFVVLSAVTAFFLNLLSMSVFLGFVLQLIHLGDEIQVTIDPFSFLLMFVAAVLTAALLAAVFMVIAIPARTYREGQAALSPANLLAMVPGLVVGASREPFGLSQAFVPVLNSTALFEAVLEGKVEALPVAVTYLVLAVTTAAALFVAARIVARDDVFLEPRFSLRDLLKGGARP